MPQIVTGPIPQAARDGLRAAVGTPAVQENPNDPLDPDDKWRAPAGGCYERTPCSGGTVHDPCAVHDFDPVDRPGTRCFQPVGLIVGRECSTTGWEAQDLATDAARLMEASQYALLAGELWTGATSKAAVPDLANVWLAKDGHAGYIDVITAMGGNVATDWFTPQDGLAALEEVISSQMSGPGVIHTPRSLAVYWDAYLRWDSGRLYTKAGTQVVADRGYPGSGPDSLGNPAGDIGGADGVWAYVTGPLTIRIETGAPLVVPPVDQFEQAVNRSTNDIAYYASRLAAWTWDCVHGGLRIRNCKC